MDLDPATFKSSDGGGKARLHLRRDRLVCERQKLYRKKSIEIPYNELISATVTNSTSTARKLVEKNGFSVLRYRIIANSTLALRTDDSASPGERVRGDTLEVHYVHRESSDINKWECRKLSLKHADTEVISRYKKLLDKALSAVSAKRPKRLLVFINPYGGVGKAEKVFENTVKPIFDLANIRYEVVVTKRANHAHDMLQTYDFNAHKVDGVICVGGDGMFSELINGVLKRAASDNSLDVNDPSQTMARPDIKIGVIPGGSTDALAYSLHGADDVITSTLHIVLGDERHIDGASVFTNGRLTRFSSTMMSYGYFGDLMVRSEGYRWLGPSRYDISGTRTLLANRSYRGVVGYLEEVNPESNPKNRQPCTSDCSVCQAEWDDMGVSSLALRRDTVKGKFMNVTGAMMTCSCHRTPKGISPGAHLSDGNADLIIVKKTSRLNYLRYLARVAFQHDNPFELPYVEVRRVREFSFTVVNPADGRQAKTSVWNCDGEILTEANIHVRVHRRVLKVFGRGPETKATARPTVSTTTSIVPRQKAIEYIPQKDTPTVANNANSGQRDELSNFDAADSISL